MNYDYIFPDWELKDLPHGSAGKPEVNVGYADGHAKQIAGEEYFELSAHTGQPNRYKDEGFNMFIANGWEKVYADPNDLNAEME